MKKHHGGKNIKTEPSDQASPLSPQNIQNPSSVSSNIRTSPFPLNEDGTNQTTPGLALPATDPTTQDQIDVSHDVMEISDESENDNGPASQARPPVNPTRARGPRPRVSASGARTRAPAVPSTLLLLQPALLSQLGS